MRRMVLAGLVAGLVALVSLPRTAAAETPVVVTVTGEITKANRGSFDPFEDALFAGLGETFELAYGFTLEDLRALPQVEIQVKYPNWPRAVTAKGPRLDALLDIAGATGAKVYVQALDGYSPEFSMEDVRAGQFILAITMDGTPLSLGGRGPAWLVFPPESFAGQTGEDDSGLTWSVFHIKVAPAE